MELTFDGMRRVAQGAGDLVSAFQERNWIDLIT